MYILDSTQRNYLEKYSNIQNQEKIVGPLCFLSKKNEIVLHCNISILQNLDRHNQVEDGNHEVLEMINIYQKVLSENGIDIHNNNIWKENYFRENILPSLPDDFFVTNFTEITNTYEKEVWVHALFHYFKNKVIISEEKLITQTKKGAVLREKININELLYLQEKELENLPEDKQKKLIKEKAGKLRLLFHPDKFQGYFNSINKVIGLRTLGLKKEEIIYIIKFIDNEYYNGEKTYMDTFQTYSEKYQLGTFIVDVLKNFLNKKEDFIIKIKHYFNDLNYIYRNIGQQEENIIFKWENEGFGGEDFKLKTVPIGTDFNLGYTISDEGGWMYEKGIVKLFFNKFIVPIDYRTQMASYFSYINIKHLLAFIDFNNGINVKYEYINDIVQELKKDNFFSDIDNSFQEKLLTLINQRNLGIEGIINKLTIEHITKKIKNKTFDNSIYPNGWENKRDNLFILRRLLNEIYYGPKFTPQIICGTYYNLHVIQENSGILFITYQYDENNEGKKVKEFFLPFEDLNIIRNFVDRKQIKK